MDLFLQNLLAVGGTFRGKGVNHEDQNFVGELTVRAVFAGAALMFRATGDGGEMFHEEEVLIGPAPTGGLAMTSLNSNMPFLQDFVSETVRARAVSFIHGDFTNSQSFRERVTIELANGEICYAFLWGMPGEEVAPRSRVVMRRA